MKQWPIVLLSLSMLTSCGATVKVEDGSGGTDHDVITGGLGNGSASDDDGSSLGGGFSDGGFSPGVGGSPPEPSPDCYDDGSAFVLDPNSVGGVQTGQGACNSMQPFDWVAACVGPMATEASCSAFINASPENTSCSQCITGASAEPPVPMPVVIMSSTSPYLTLYACLAHVEEMPQCELPVQSLVFCAFSACEQCLQDGEEWNECVNWALNESDLCTTIELPPGCEELFAVRQIPEECLGNATTLEEALPILAGYYCGAP